VVDVRFVKVIVSDVGAFIFKSQAHKLKLEDNYFRHDCNFQLPAVASTTEWRQQIAHEQQQLFILAPTVSATSHQFHL